MTDPTKELAFQNDVIAQMGAVGWKLGDPAHYDRALALYPEDVVGFVKDTQPEQWQKFCALYPANPEQKFLERVAEQLDKADPNAADKIMRTFGTLGVLRHELRDRGTRFSLCQFKPEHDLNPDTFARYGQNRLRLVPELVYSPWATETELGAGGAKPYPPGRRGAAGRDGERMSEANDQGIPGGYFAGREQLKGAARLPRYDPLD